MSDKSTWKKVKLGDIAQEISARVDTPAKSGFDKFVGLEHFVSGDMKISRYGSTESLISSMKEFHSGDVLLARRNVYLKRASQAAFDGLCSGDAIVLRERNGKIASNLLPFILNTNEFWSFANANADGSMSKRINVKTLLNYEFCLPPIEEQKRIAEVLWATDENVCAQKDIIKSLKYLQTAMIDDFSKRYVNTTSLENLLSDIKYGTSTRVSPRKETSVPVLRIPNIARGEITYNDIGWVELNEKEINRYILSQGDILLVRTNGNPEYVGRAALVDSKAEGYVFASYLIRLKCKGMLMPEFLHLYLNHTTVRNKLLQEIKSSAGNYNLNTNGIKSLEIPDVALEEQAHLVEEISVLENTLGSAIKQLESNSMLLSQLIHNFLGGAN